MANIAHNPADVAPPFGGYSHGVEIGPGARLLFISGEIPEQPDGQVPMGFDNQCEAVWDNIEAILAAAGMGVPDLVKVTTFLTHPDQVVANREIRTRRLKGARPALTVVIVQTLESAWLLEMEAIAAGAPE
jgi:enamine deaminase RidA (YjgF/YER057c/UK114 family)